MSAGSKMQITADSHRKGKGAKPGHGHGQKSWLRENVESMVNFGVVVIIAMTFVVKPYRIPSGSMESTLHIGDMILVDRSFYLLEEPGRGDIAVFKTPPAALAEHRRLPGNADVRTADYIKRIVGLPGEKIEILENRLYADGRRVEEPASIADNVYYDGPVTSIDQKFPQLEKGYIDVPQAHVLCLGDNSANSLDGRVWGTVPVENLKGKAFLIYWPLDRVALLRDR